MIAAGIAEVMAKLSNLLRRQSGLTFHEVLVAMNIIVVAIMGYYLSTAGVIRGQTANDNFTVALHLAQDKMEQINAQANMVNDNHCPSTLYHAVSATGSTGGTF